MEAPIYIIGHKNPDADAICSAIGYAAYKKARGESSFVAARCGNSNARIDAILKRFKTPLPKFIGDVTPRVSDIMVSDVHKVNINGTCADALDLIDLHDIRSLPVVDDTNTFKGILSVFDLGNSFIPKASQSDSMRRVHTSINDIIKALNATPINLVNPDSVEDFYVRIGAMDIRSFGKYYTNDSEVTKSSIIVVGDRYDIQQRSIQLGVRILVVSGGLPIDEDVIQIAQERGVTLISSPNDSASTSWLIRSAERINRIFSEAGDSFFADDKLSTVRRRIQNSNRPMYPVVDQENKLLGIFSKTDLLRPVKTELVLVDHNELTQAVTGAAQVKIREIIDHHRLGNQPSEQPIVFINRPLGSTSTIVADAFRSEGLPITPQIAGVLMGGIISDTLNLQGPTTTEVDRDILSWLAGIAKCEADELAQIIFSSGSIIISHQPEEVIRADMKIYKEGDISFSVSQVEELGFDNFRENDDALRQALINVREKENLYFSTLLVTNINTQDSLLLICGEEEFTSRISYPHHKHSDAFELQGIVSRKKQLIPYLCGLINGVSL